MVAIDKFVWKTEPDASHFEQLEAAGLGSRDDWLRCFDVDPDDYQLDDDVSARWLVRT